MADGLTDGVSELAVAVALPVVGLADIDGVTVAVAVVVTSAVWVAVAVVVTVTIGVGVTAGVTGVEVLDVGRADVLVDGGTDGVCDRAGTVGALAVGRPTEGPPEVRLGTVPEGVGRPLLLTLGGRVGNVADRLGVTEPSPACPQAARANPAAIANAAVRTRIIDRS